jgi:hypothetical protein
MTLPGSEPRYEVARKGAPLGTYALSEVAAEIASGKLTWTDDCWSEGMGSWGKLSDIQAQVQSLSAVGSGVAGPTRALLYSGIAGIGILAIGVATFLHLSSASDVGEVRPVPDSSPVSTTTTRRTLDKPLCLSLSETQAKISAIVASSFDAVKNSAGLTTYSHRYYRGVGNRIPLRVEVDMDGKCHLRTYFHGKNWIFHDRLKFVFNKQILETTVIPAYRCAREVAEDNSVTESCRFDGPDDMKIVGLLAASCQTQIMFSMVGKTTVEAGLSHETKEALKESYELAELLSSRKKLLAELAAGP